MVAGGYQKNSGQVTDEYIKKNVRREVSKKWTLNDRSVL